MRLNKRRILKAPKRGPDYFKIELEKLKVLKRSPAYIMRQFVRAMSTAVTTITTAIIRSGQWLFQCLKPVVDAVNNYSRYRKEDKDLFKSFPSIRRFEKDMV
jgi:hypothetical protein